MPIPISKLKDNKVDDTRSSPARRQSLNVSKPRIKATPTSEPRPRSNSLTNYPTSGRRSASLSRSGSFSQEDPKPQKSTQEELHLKQAIKNLENLSSKHEALLSRHEAVITKCEVLEVRHQDLMSKHQSVLNLLNQIVTKSSNLVENMSLNEKSNEKTHDVNNLENLKKNSSWTSNRPQPAPKSPVLKSQRLLGSPPKKNSNRASLNNHTPGDDHGLRVCIRKRPAMHSETDCVECVDFTVLLHEDKVKVDLTKYESVTKFSLDGVFGENHSTADVYIESVQDLIDNFFNGGTSTCFCFGQTASGKTFTLFGEGGGTQQQYKESLLDSGESGGIYMLAAADAFDRLKLLREREGNDNLVLQLSMFEIYGQKVRDLLADCKELAALEDGNGVLQLVGLEAYVCADIEDFVQASNKGRGARATNATGANATSSRSHGALLLRLVNTANSEVLGKFSLIDLAGSERGADNDNTDKTTQMEGRQINQSLLALKEVIRAKELGRHHAPFRQSRLTQVLEESLTGSRCHTTVIGCVSPCIKDTQQTLNTLRYAESLSPNTGKRPSLPKKSSAESVTQVQEGITTDPEKSPMFQKPIFSSRLSIAMLDMELDAGNTSRARDDGDNLLLSAES